MLFTSPEFALFVFIVFGVYWWVLPGSLRGQNLWIALVSYVFYGWWDPRFLILIFISTVFDFLIAFKIDQAADLQKRKWWLGCSITVNLGFLGVFKYCNFFIENFLSLLQLIGIKADPFTLQIILPVGISFYTFQSLSYTIDVYRKQMRPVTDFVSFVAFVSFFPQLVAGPIERAQDLLPQFLQNRIFNYHAAIDGLRQILWGLFKKVVIADACGDLADTVFSSPSDYNSRALILGVLFFSVQIYGDFSGYSDIAIGAARLFGFNLTRNFYYPYFSRDVAEFWRRWHISLSTWFRDYLYIPMGGSRCGRYKQIRNTLIVFIASGFWHGSKWTFIIWGMLHALYFIPLLISGRNRTHLGSIAAGRFLPSWREGLSIIATFSLTSFAWIFFRAENLPLAFGYIQGIVSSTILQPSNLDTKMVEYLVIYFFLLEWVGREEEYAVKTFFTKFNPFMRWSLYYVFVVSIIIASSKQTEFIYFQF
jgi:D-alanyl-lipoteichoic acid acyltransferase DltB (MBOAT superfamily)